MRLEIKLGLALLAGVALSFALVVHAGLGTFDRELRTVRASHLGFAVDEVAHAITVRTDLGLQLEAIPEIAALLDRTQAGNADIDRLMVFDADARVVFSTDQTDLGTTIAAGGNIERRIEADERAITVVSPVINNFGKTVGGVLLESEARHSAPLHERAAIVLLGIAAGVAFICLLLVVLFCRWTLRPVLDMLRQSETCLLAMAEGRETELDGAAPSLSGFHDTAAGMLAAMDSDAREIDRLDRIG